MRSISTCTSSKSRPACGNLLSFCAASFICSYSSRRRISSARGSSSLSSSLCLGRTRQQHARLDLDQHRRHQQVFGCQFQAMLLHHLDVGHVLLGERRHRDVEHVEVVLADQVQQQVERPLERLQHHFQRIRRDVQVLRHLHHRFAVDMRHRVGRLRLLELYFGLAHGVSCSPAPSPRARRAWSRSPACVPSRNRRR